MMWGSSAYSKLTESRSKNDRQITDTHKMRHSFSSHIVNMRQKQIKEGAVHSTLRPRWCEEIQLPQSLPNAYWLLIDTSPKIKKWDTPLVLISSTCNKNKQKNGAMHSTLRPWWCGGAHIDENRGLDESKIVGNQGIGSLWVAWGIFGEIWARIFVARMGPRWVKLALSWSKSGQVGPCWR